MCNGHSPILCISFFQYIGEITQQFSCKTSWRSRWIVNHQSLLDPYKVLEYWTATESIMKWKKYISQYSPRTEYDWKGFSVESIGMIFTNLGPHNRVSTPFLRHFCMWFNLSNKNIEYFKNVNLKGYKYTCLYSTQCSLALW